MTSCVAASINKHLRALQDSEQILSYGKANKNKAITMHLNKIRDENEEIAKRLMKVQRSSLVHSNNNNSPGGKAHSKQLKERRKYLDMARRNTQGNLDFENSLILKRLTRTQSTVPNNQKLKDDFSRHRKIRRNMCKLQCPEQSAKKVRRGKRVRPSSRALPSLSHSPTLPESFYQEPLFEKSTPIKHRQSSEDRGQICHEWIELTHIIPGESPSLKQALLIGFKKPDEDSTLLFEVSCEGVVLYAPITFEQMKDAINESSMSENVSQSSVLALAAASRLTLFGKDTEDMMLVWNDKRN